MTFLRSLSLFAAVFAAYPASASELLIEGTASAAAPYGSSVSLEFIGTPLKQAFVLADLSPGPVVVLGESVPIGLSPATQFVASATLDGGGALNFGFAIPSAPVLSGITVYFVGAVLDENDSNGLDVSNGASLLVQPPVDAGPSQSAIVGKSVILDGTGAANLSGELPLGATLLWELVEQPPGSMANIDHATELLGVLTPDIAGNYRAQLTVSHGGADAVAETSIHAYRIQLAASQDGDYLAIPIATIQGTLFGPPPAAFSLNGEAVELQPNNTFGPILENYGGTGLTMPLLFEIEDADGSRVRDRFSVGMGAGANLASSSQHSLAAHMNQPTLDQIAEASSELLEETDVEALLLEFPPTQVANEEGLFGFTIFSATVDFTGLSYEPALDVTLTAQPSGVLGVVQINDVFATFDVFGELLEIPYSLTGSITSSPVDLSAVLTFSATGGQVSADVQDIAVTRNNFDFDLDGFLGDVAQLFVIESSVKQQVEDVVADAIGQELGPSIEEILNGFTLGGSLLKTLEVDTFVSAPITEVDHSSGGVTIYLDGNAQAVSSEPGSPTISHFLATPTSPPSFGFATPDSGTPYGAALAAADDFLNQVLAAATGSGLLDGDLAELLSAGGKQKDDLTTGILDDLFFGAGFDNFPGSTVVDLRAHGTMPPLFRATPGEPTLGSLELADLEIRFEVPTRDVPIPILLISLDGIAALDLSVGLDGSLAATLGASDLAVTALSAFPGADLDQVQFGIDFLASLLLPQLEQALGEIPLPSLEAQGLGLMPSEVSYVGGGQEYIGFFGEMTSIEK